MTATTAERDEMYAKIMVPVDLDRLEALGKALAAAEALSERFGAPLFYVAVLAGVAGEEHEKPFGERLAAFARDRLAASGRPGGWLAVVEANVGAGLETARDRLAADLVVMGSHPPSFTDYLWGSRAGAFARHAPCSVMIVR